MDTSVVAARTAKGAGAVASTARLASDVAGHLLCARTGIEVPTLRRIVAQPVPVPAKLLLVQAFLRLGDLPLGHPVKPCMTDIYLHI